MRRSARSAVTGPSLPH